MGLLGGLLRSPAPDQEAQYREYCAQMKAGNQTPVEFKEWVAMQERGKQQTGSTVGVRG